jgi:hypothetical protein
MDAGLLWQIQIKWALGGFGIFYQDISAYQLFLGYGMMSCMDTVHTDMYLTWDMAWRRLHGVSGSGGDNQE